MSERVYSTGLIPASPAELRGLAFDVEHWTRDAYAGDLEARICAALMSADGWDYQPEKPYQPAVKEGRKIVRKAVYAVGPRIYRHWTTPGDGRSFYGSIGSEETRAPSLLTQMQMAWGLMDRGYVLIHLSDISGNGLPAAHVGGGPEMRAEGKAFGAATTEATLVAAILRCEAMAREIEADA